MKKQLVRTRFAPSPTGFLHIGGLRTALYNYLFAKKNQGQFILRIEDTDRERYLPEAASIITATLKKFGINYDEGPDCPGPNGPYIQSERKDIYHKQIQNLIDNNKAYYCFCSAEELESYRQYQMSKGEAPKYSGKCVSLSEQETEKLLKENKNCAVRLRVEIKKIKFNFLECIIL